jgi:hypothetical protein
LENSWFVDHTLKHHKAKFCLVFVGVFVAQVMRDMAGQVCKVVLACYHLYWIPEIAQKYLAAKLI